MWILKSRVPVHMRLSQKYQKWISGPLLDRIDIHIEVPRLDYEKLSGDRVGNLRMYLQTIHVYLNVDSADISVPSTRPRRGL